MIETPKVCLSVAGLDPSGGAGIIADVKTFAAFRCFPTTVITALTFQNTQGVYGAIHQDAASVRGQFLPIIDDFEIAAMKTGMLPSRDVIREAASIIQERKIRNLIVDPVVRSTSGFDLIDDEALRSLVEEMFPLADLITPNIPEAERISGMKLENVQDVEKAARAMQAMGARNVLIKGGHALHAEQVEKDGKLKAIDYLFVGGDVLQFESDYIDSTSTHGTGCVLSAAITANLALGNDLNTAVEIAKDFVTEGIRSAPKLGRGNSPVSVRC